MKRPPESACTSFAWSATVIGLRAKATAMPVPISSRSVRSAAYELSRFVVSDAQSGSWGKDGLLYVSGHDRPELYALRVPKGGGTMELVATIGMPTVAK